MRRKETTTRKNTAVLIPKSKYNYLLQIKQTKRRGIKRKGSRTKETSQQPYC